MATPARTDPSGGAGTSRPKGPSSKLDGPPPSPVTDPSAQPGGENALGTPQGLQGLAAPIAIPSGQLPPQILTGLMARIEEMKADLDSFAQVTPDLGPEWALIADLLMQTAGKLLTAGASPARPTTAGPGFPGGGFGGQQM